MELLSLHLSYISLCVVSNYSLFLLLSSFFQSFLHLQVSPSQCHFYRCPTNSSVASVNTSCIQTTSMLSLRAAICSIYLSVHCYPPPCAKQSQLDAIKYAIETEDHLLIERLGKAGIDVFSTYPNATHDEVLSVAIKK